MSSVGVNQEIDNKVIIVYGKMGQGKSLIATLIATFGFEKRLYSNLTIYKKGKQINKDIKYRNDIEKIRFSFTPGLIIIDEGGINMSSRRSSSDINVFLSEVIFLSRKKNCSLIFVSQRFESLDINIRVLADLILKAKKVRTKTHPFFIAQKQKQINNKLMTIREIKINVIKIFEIEKIEYNTLESSRINFDKKEKEPIESKKRGKRVIKDNKGE